MYNIDQYSLREYIITNTSLSSNLVIAIDKYENTTFNPRNVVDSWTYVNLITLEVNGYTKVVLESDGIYRITLTSVSLSEAEVFIIHNITDLLKRKQDFLTSILVEYKIDPKHHNQYYDFISFSVLFETYNKLVRELFTKGPAASDLYMVEYLLKELQKY